MEVMTALKQRQSIRAFKPAPVPREMITKILEAARWSPSWGNTQPWELVVVGGDAVQRLAADLVKNFEEKVPANPDVPMPLTFPDVYKSRYMACASGLFGAMGITREDKAARWAHMVRMTRGFGAPTFIYVIFHSDLNEPYTMWDLGAIAHAVVLAAWDQGLGTCILAQLAHYPDLVRRHLGLPETHRIAVGIALGHADTGSPANAFRTDREPLETFVRWVGY